MDANGASQIVSALQLIYDVKSDNAQRVEAQKFLDQVRSREESPFWGYQIALNNPSDFILKHFGLGLVAEAIKKNWAEYDKEKRIALKKWVLELNFSVQEHDPRYIKEKLAFLWVEVAKRVWGEALKATSNPDEQDALASWVDMDSNFTSLWNINKASRELTLIIFRILFEDVFLLDDMVVLKRMSVIQPLCVLLVSPIDVFTKRYKFTDKWVLFKANKDGWLTIWISELNNALQIRRNGGDEYNSEYIVRLLETLKTCLNWPQSEIIVNNDVMSSLLQCFLTGIPKAQSVALDSIHILLTRPYTDQSHYQYVINKVFDNMDLLDKVYDSLQFDPTQDIDEVKYPILKKFVDMISCLYVCVFKIKDTDNQIGKYFKLVLKATSNPSLIVSGLTLDLWCSCLRNDDFLPILDKHVMADLLQLVADSLTYYEQIDDHVSKLYSEVDFQTTSDFENFCSTYRKRIRDIIRLISCVKLDMTYQWLNNRLGAYFSSTYGQQVLSSTFLNRKSEPYLSALAQLMIVECFINGCIRWKIWYPTGSDYNDKLDNILANLQVLSNQLLALNLREPLLLKKQIQNFALFLTMLKDDVLFTLLEKIITSATMDYPEIDLEGRSDEADAVRDLRYACGIELNRMALLMPESLKEIYPDLENVITRIMPNLSYHEKISFKSFLLTIVLKSSLNRKEERFAAIVDPELIAWSDKSTVVGLSDLPWFMERLGIVKIAEYFQKRGIDENSDLLTIPIDDEGKKLKLELTKHWETLFPVRATRMFIHYSMQSLKKEEDMKLLQAMWRPRIVPILPYIMRLLYQLQSYHDPENWKELPIVVQKFVKYSTVERFWEAGTSNKSKNEFIDEHMKAMHTLRDFADSVGHIVRYTREYTLLVISAISSLGNVFFELDEAPILLLDSVAIYKPERNEISPGVSTYGWKHIIHGAIRPILKNCPEECIPKFMSAFLPKFFETLDILLCSRWSANSYDVETKQVDEDEMTEEILEENLLRQLTTVVVRILMDCVGQSGTTPQTLKGKYNQHQLAMRKLIFNDIKILAPFLKLLNHLICFKDSKCSFNALLVLKCCLADILIKDSSVDEFFTVEVMKDLLLNVFCQSTFKDSFNEALYVFTLLFVTLCKEYKSTRVYLYELSHGYDIDLLYENLKNVDNYKDQKSIMIEFIDWVKTTVGSNGEDEGIMDQTVADRKRQQKRDAILEKANERLIKKNKEEGNMLDDPNLEDSAFGNLFN